MNERKPQRDSLLERPKQEKTRHSLITARRGPSFFQSPQKGCYSLTSLPPPLCAAALCPAWFLPFLLPHSLSLLTSRCLSLSLFLLLFSVGGSASPRWCSRSLSLASGSAPSRSGPPSLPRAPSASLSRPSVLSSFPLSPSFSASHPDWLGLFIKGPHFLMF